MRVERTVNGLYVFPLSVSFKSQSKKLLGLVDTGSNICAGTYKIFTTLHAKPTSFKKIQNPAKDPVRALGYSLTIRFDNKGKMVSVYRLPFDMGEIHFILGMSILADCKISMQKNYMDIEWN